jgi:hypothetical protein
VPVSGLGEVSGLTGRECARRHQPDVLDYRSALPMMENMDRPRACAAVIRDDTILMVEHKDDVQVRLVLAAL